MKIFLFTFSIFCSYYILGQKTETHKPFVLGFYNLENLFDTINDPYTDDHEYLPTSAKKWNSKKYNHKINFLARSIASINNWEGPDLLGVCEVEHKSCLEDLTQLTALQQLNYEIIHWESDDNRGIDVACIYKKESFKPIYHHFFRIHMGQHQRPTRDILYIKGIAHQTDTIHYFANHWPSRFGGAAKSEPKRIKVATFLRTKIDSILKTDIDAKIIITGDFNDGTTDLSITKHLKAYPETQPIQEHYLFNTSYNLQHNQKLGTHKYRDEWNLFDQMIISNNLLDTNSTIYTRPNDSKIHGDKDWINEQDDISLDKKPFRSYYGKNFIGGYSDHYAISLTLWVRN